MVGLSCPAPLLQAVARKRQQSRHASRVLLQVDRVVWQLCTLARDQLFVQVGVDAWNTLLSDITEDDIGL